MLITSGIAYFLQLLVIVIEKASRNLTHFKTRLRKWEIAELFFEKCKLSEIIVLNFICPDDKHMP